MRPLRPLAIALCLSIPLFGADCAACHPAEAELHAASAHASALARPKGSLFASRLPDRPLGEAADGYAFEYRETGDGLEVTAQRGAESASAEVAWIFGAGRQGLTPVLIHKGHFIEHRVSFYSATGYRVTIGQENGISANAEKALGRVETTGDARLCFNCHATVRGKDFADLTPGVQCVRCHAGAERHADGLTNPARITPVNPGKLEHRAQVRLCGECHRLAPPPGSADNDIGNVRFQPLRLMKSACFQKGDIRCTTCHPAHRDAQRQVPDWYNGQCVHCHADRAAHVAKEGSGDCLECHMPKVSPAPALTFTDHYIRKTVDKR